MADVTTTPYVPARLWLTAVDWTEDFENDTVDLEVERTDPNEIAIHTFIGGAGSKASFYFDRETAMEIGVRLINAARLR